MFSQHLTWSSILRCKKIYKTKQSISTTKVKIKKGKTKNMSQDKKTNSHLKLDGIFYENNLQLSNGLLKYPG